MIPRTFAPAPSWSVDGHRIKAPLEYSRGDDKVWIYGALRVRDGKEITRCAAARNSKNYIELLKDIEADNPTGDIFIITDNLSSHNSLETRTWRQTIHASSTSSFPKARVGSTCKRAGGGSSAAMRSLARAWPMPMRLSERCRWPPSNSTTEPSRGSGDGLPRRVATCVASFVIAFDMTQKMSGSKSFC